MRDTVEIHASPERVFGFFLHFKENYCAWHPDHVECRYLTDGPLGEGSIIYVEEYLHGVLHKLKFRVTELVPHSRIECEFFGGEGIFIVEPCNSGVLFTAEQRFGIETPILGELLDRFAHVLFGRQLESLRQHMVEEGQNLKRIIEQGAC